MECSEDNVLQDGMHGMQRSQCTIGGDAVKFRYYGMGRMGRSEEMHYGKGHTGHMECKFQKHLCWDARWCVQT